MAKKLKLKTEAEVAAFNAGVEAAMKACLQAIHLEAKDWRGAARRVAAGPGTGKPRRRRK